MTYVERVRRRASEEGLAGVFRAGRRRLGRERQTRMAWRAVDRAFDAWYGMETMRPASVGDLTIDGPNTDFGNETEIYVATPILALRRSFRFLPADVREWSFVDYGSGKGRVLAFAGRRPFRRVVGVEFADELHAQAVRNVGRVRRRLACRSVEARHGDATELEPPAGPCIFFFYNPFERPVMERVLARIERSLRDDPRPAMIVAHGNFPADLIHEIGGYRLAAAGPGVRGIGVTASFRVYVNDAVRVLR